MIGKCECDHAGYCPLFQRAMNQKDWQTCQRRDEKGQKFRINCAREAGLTEHVPQAPELSEERSGDEDEGNSPETGLDVAEPVQAHHVVKNRPRGRPAPKGVKKVLLNLPNCAGDCLVATAALESVATQYPGRFWIGIDAHDNQPIFENNPHVKDLNSDDKTVTKVNWEYPLIQSSNQRPIHFMDAYTASLAEILGVPLYTSVKKPHIYLSAEEKGWTNQVQEITKRQVKFWLVNSGHKPCFTTKRWDEARYQEIVDHFAGRIQFVQIGQPEHNKVHLKNCIDLVGQTNLRQLIRLAFHCEGAIGPSTFLQHLSAAFEKPYVLIDSVREPCAWVSYPNQVNLVKYGQLKCCVTNACWKSHVSESDPNAGGVCEQPVVTGLAVIPRCTAMIRSSDVIAAIEGFYSGGRLAY